jgi:hypothetical protein
MDLFSDAQRPWLVSAAQEQRELLAADAAGKVSGPVHAGGQATGKPLQHLIAYGVTVAVVEALEMVGVHDEHRERLGRTQCLLARQGQGLLEPASVAETGQGIGFREPGHLGMHPLTVAELPTEEQGEGHGQAAQHENDDADPDGLGTPRGLGLPCGNGNVKHQGETPTWAKV